MTVHPDTCLRSRGTAAGADRAVVYLENQGRLTLTTEGTMMPSFGNVSRFFARDGHAYLLEGGLSIYRLS